MNGYEYSVPPKNAPNPRNGELPRSCQGVAIRGSSYGISVVMVNDIEEATLMRPHETSLRPPAKNIEAIDVLDETSLRPPYHDIKLFLNPGLVLLVVDQTGFLFDCLDLTTNR